MTYEYKGRIVEDVTAAQSLAHILGCLVSTGGPLPWGKKCRGPAEWVVLDRDSGHVALCEAHREQSEANPKYRQTFSMTEWAEWLKAQEKWVCPCFACNQPD